MEIKFFRVGVRVGKVEYPPIDLVDFFWSRVTT